jgi:hypothetical protein
MPSTPDTPAGLDRLFPDAAALAALDPAHSLLSPELGALGIVRQRQRALLALAHAVQAGRLQLDGSAPLADTLAALTALPGIGDWTAQYIALRALRWPDAFPAGDVVLQNRLGTRQAGRSPREAALATEAASAAWRPWRGYAVLQLWEHAGTPGPMAPTVPPPRRTLSPHVAPIFFLSPFRRTDRHDHLHRPGPARVRQPAGPHAPGRQPTGPGRRLVRRPAPPRPNSPAPAPGPSPGTLLRQARAIAGLLGRRTPELLLPLDLSAGTAPSRPCGRRCAPFPSATPAATARWRGSSAGRRQRGRWGGRGPQPGVGRRALPPRAGRRRQPDRLCRRPGAQALLRLEACPWRGAAPAQTELAWEAAR